MFGGKQRRKRSVWFALTVGGLVVAALGALLEAGLLSLGSPSSHREEDLGVIAREETRELPVGHEIRVTAEREDLDPGVTTAPSQWRCTVVGPGGAEPLSVDSQDLARWVSDKSAHTVRLATIPRVAPGADQVRCDGFTRVRIEDMTIYASSDHGLTTLFGAAAVQVLASVLIPLGLVMVLTGGIGLLVRWSRRRRSAEPVPGTMQHWQVPPPGLPATGPGQMQRFPAPPPGDGREERRVAAGGIDGWAVTSMVVGLVLLGVVAPLLLGLGMIMGAFTALGHADAMDDVGIIAKGTPVARATLRPAQKVALLGSSQVVLDHPDMAGGCVVQTPQGERTIQLDWPHLRSAATYDSTLHITEYVPSVEGEHAFRCPGFGSLEVQDRAPVAAAGGRWSLRASLFVVVPGAIGAVGLAMTVWSVRRLSRGTVRRGPARS